MSAANGQEPAPAAGFQLIAIEGCRLISSIGDPPDKLGRLEVICVSLQDGPGPSSSSSSSTPPSSSSRRPPPPPPPRRSLDASSSSRPSLAPTTTTNQTTTLSSQNITLDEPDVWLVVRVDGYEFVISPIQSILQSRAKRTFTFLERPGEKPRSLTLVLPSKVEAARRGISNVQMEEDIETLEALFAQYGVLQEIDRDGFGSDGDLKGRLVLVDQNDGQFVGWLGNDVSITEDPVVEQEHNKDPVVVNISEDGHHMDVRPARPEDEEYILRGAGAISRGIVSIGDAVSVGFSKASAYYISHVTPNADPIEVSEATRARVARVNHFSGKAVTVTKSTTGAIHNAIDKMAKRVGAAAKAHGPGSGTSTPNGNLDPSMNGNGNGNGDVLNGPGTDGKEGNEHGLVTVPAVEKKKLLKQVVQGVNLIVSAVEQSAETIFTSGGQGVSAGIHHKYGQQAGETAEGIGRSMRNVKVVYVDASGIGRRALLTRMGKGAVKARIAGEDVIISNEPVLSNPPSGSSTPNIGAEGKMGSAPSSSSTSLQMNMTSAPMRNSTSSPGPGSPTASPNPKPIITPPPRRAPAPLPYTPRRRQPTMGPTVSTAISSATSSSKMSPTLSPSRSSPKLGAAYAAQGNGTANGNGNAIDRPGPNVMPGQAPPSYAQSIPPPPRRLPPPFKPRDGPS